MLSDPLVPPPVADALARRRSLPPGAHWETLAIDGWPVRSVRWPGAGAASAGSILFVGGRADFIEKYSEAYWSWRDCGYAVATFDWRGQGKSGRLGGDPHKGHGDFDRWLDDLRAIVGWFERTLPPPHYFVAHSMGGHLMLRYLADGGRAFRRGVLLAPMLGIGLVRSTLMRRLADLMSRFGLARRYALFQRGYGDWQLSRRRQALLTGCDDRFADRHWWIEGDPELALGGVTYGWLAGAYRSIDALLAPGVIERIDLPLLLIAGELERLVDSAAIRAAAARLPRARLEIIAGGRHELLREVDPVRTELHAQIRAFLA